jgi:predicted N-acyltransferase
MDVPLDLVAPPLIARCLRAAGRVFPRLRYQRTLFVGSPCSDEGTVGLLPEVPLAEVAPLLQKALEGRARQVGASMIVWKDFPQTTDAPLAALSTQGRLFKLVSYPGTRLPLPEGGFPAYLQALTSHYRYNLRRKLRRSKALGDLHLSVLQYPSQELLADIFALFWQTYQRGKTQFERLTPRFFQLVAEEEVSYFVLLRDPESNKPVAFMLCFRVGSRIINKFIGLDYRYSGDWFLYFRLWEQAVEWASLTHATELQSGQTGYRAKLDLGHELIPLFNYCCHQNPVLHYVFASIARNISWQTLDEDLATRFPGKD